MAEPTAPCFLLINISQGSISFQEDIERMMLETLRNSYTLEFHWLDAVQDEQSLPSKVAEQLETSQTPQKELKLGMVPLGICCGMEAGDPILLAKTSTYLPARLSTKGIVPQLQQEASELKLDPISTCCATEVGKPAREAQTQAMRDV
ncbi:hypothetical protein P7K49_009787 [Saguinus oedipus]|uniref:Uncharacterized protein n=1 Tax=Saguinus oedipus TaxID=9490 RepID=A0ABQ9VKY6_SAGOE|nr:hypothetical protein P7K49_009787 [Saguinus oedipus]